MLGVLAGDTASLTVLVERYYGPLLGYLYRLLGGDRPLAEDIAQETFLRVLQQGSYQQGRPFKPFSGIYPFMDTGHSWYPVPASQRGVSLIHLATDQPALPSPQAFHPSRGTPGRDLVGWFASPALPGSARH